jgi:hypothetical protein
MSQNDGRKAKGWLPKMIFTQPNPVVQVINDETGEILYTVRVKGKIYQPKVFSPGKYSVKSGINQADKTIISETAAVQEKKGAETRKVEL